MKTIKVLILFNIIAAFSWAADWETYHILNRLLTLPGPGAPVPFEDVVIFTSSSSNRRAGVAFAHEDFSRVYWYRQLLIPQDPLDAPIPPGKKVPDPYTDSGLLFHVYQVPEDLTELEYRLIINGLWTVDPLNPKTRKDPVSGLTWSVLSLLQKNKIPHVLKGPPGSPASSLNFTFNGPPGEIVTVAGNFNSWDPFMYQLVEAPAGVYSLSLPLPPGRYHYVFFHRGQRYIDPNNPKRVYSQDGSIVSEIVIP